ncbi:cytochrome b561 [Thioclava sp. ES.031]|uniref:cytochrome b n=1 Tax=unclassified Thioclava TaxID=2621713 RepID=UPI0009960CBB|nr:MULTISPECIES: cytochrome b [unclassified Thioclava]MPQ95811.1 cytochrome b [Thioclava sp. JE_KL1]OOY21997.1 cytochrome B [Thioclava sp. DLFJ5-1]PFG62129.1 cytochrome b561 [Thioclava sp. ES.031]
MRKTRHEENAAYSAPARWLHWSVAVLVLGLIAAGQVMIAEGLAPSVRDLLYLFHKNAGVIIGALMLIRLGYRIAHPPPPLPATTPHWQARVAHVTHALLYLLVFVMVVSGYTRVRAGGYPIEGLDALGLPRLVAKEKGLETAAKAIHAYARLGLIALIALHIGAAFYHTLWLRDGLLRRMWPRRSGQ